MVVSSCVRSSKFSGIFCEETHTNLKVSAPLSLWFTLERLVIVQNLQFKPKLEALAIGDLFHSVHKLSSILALDVELFHAILVAEETTNLVIHSEVLWVPLHLILFPPGHLSRAHLPLHCWYPLGRLLHHHPPLYLLSDQRHTLLPGGGLLWPLGRHLISDNLYLPHYLYLIGLSRAPLLTTFCLLTSCCSHGCRGT
jgi:hypothetical protein